MIFFRKKQPPANRQPARDLPSRRQNYSYYASRQPREAAPQREQKKPLPARREPRLRHIPMLVLLLIIIGGGIYELGLTTNPKFIVLNNQAVPVSTRTYAQAAQSILKQSWTSRTKLSINTAAIEAAMIRQFPELAQASVTLPLIGHQPVLNLELAKPAATLQDAAHKNYIIGANGIVLDTTYNKPPSTTPVITTPVALQAKAGKQVLASSDVAFINSILAQLAAHHIMAQSMILPPASRELDVHIKGQPYFVKFNLSDNQDSSQQIGTYLATAAYLAGKHITPSQYIDARVLGRAYYK